ncbi:hypothetical protein D3C80_2004320 [compost metagenome]
MRCGLAHHQGCRQVDVEKVLPGLKSAFEDGFPGKAAGEIDQAVQAAEVFEDPVYGASGRFFLR